MAATQEQDQVGKFKNYVSLDLQNKIYQLKTLRLLPTLRLPPRPAVLELGSADNSFLELVVAKTGGRPTGLDIIRGDNLNKPFKVKPDHFDLVIAHEIIEHLYDTEAFLREIYRCLKPGGYLILSTPNLAALPNRFRLFFGFYPRQLEYSLKGAGHIHLYTLPVLKSQMLAIKYKIIKTTSPNFLCPFITRSWFPKPLAELCLLLGDIFPTLSSHLLVLAQKQ